MLSFAALCRLRRIGSTPAYRRLMIDGRPDCGTGVGSVVGFDDAAPARALGLTTVAQPGFDKGATAARILLALIAARASPKPQWLSTELVVRYSSGPAPADG